MIYFSCIINQEVLCAQTFLKDSGSNGFSHTECQKWQNVSVNGNLASFFRKSTVNIPIFSCTKSMLSRSDTVK
jgi:hypothetical protein